MERYLSPKLLFYPLRPCREPEPRKRCTLLPCLEAAKACQSCWPVDRRNHGVESLALRRCNLASVLLFAIFVAVSTLPPATLLLSHLVEENPAALRLSLQGYPHL